MNIKVKNVIKQGERISVESSDEIVFEENDVFITKVPLENFTEDLTEKKIKKRTYSENYCSKLQNKHDGTC